MTGASAIGAPTWTGVVAGPTRSSPCSGRPVPGKSSSSGAGRGTTRRGWRVKGSTSSPPICPPRQWRRLGRSTVTSWTFGWWTWPRGSRSQVGLDAVMANVALHMFTDAVTRAVFADVRRVLREGGCSSSTSTRTTTAHSGSCRGPWYASWSRLRAGGGRSDGPLLLADIPGRSPRRLAGGHARPSRDHARTRERARKRVWRVAARAPTGLKSAAHAAASLQPSRIQSFPARTRGPSGRRPSWIRVRHRRDEDVRNELVLDRVAALLHVVVDGCQCVDVVRELVGEKGLGNG